MHFFSKEKNFFGGHGIVGGQTPVGTGGAFAAMYRGTKGVSVTFMGDGAVAQGTFHESLNLASLWNLPAIYVIENNQYGMGTACSRAVSVENMAEAKAPGYDMRAYTMDGLDLYATWKTAQEAVTYARETSKPVLIEAKTYRYFGHSISDPGLYRTKEEVKEYRDHDPILRIGGDLVDAGWATEDDLEGIEEATRARIKQALAFAEESPEPPMSELMEHVLAP
jgi:pyruvate dehydrogenase E1 component alpha subunit